MVSVGNDVNMDPNSALVGSGRIEESESSSRNGSKLWTTSSSSEENDRFFRSSRRKERKYINKKKRIHNERNFFSRNSPYFLSGDHLGRWFLIN